jgi:hypothetical protein
MFWILDLDGIYIFGQNPGNAVFHAFPGWKLPHSLVKT